MAYGDSNGQVTVDLTWPWNDKVVTPIRLKPNISKQLEMLFSNIASLLWGSTVGYPSDSLASCYICHRQLFQKVNWTVQHCWPACNVTLYRLGIFWFALYEIGYTVNLWERFLADRTDGRAIGTVLRLSVVCLSVCLWRYVLWLNRAS